MFKNAVSGTCLDFFCTVSCTYVVTLVTAQQRITLGITEYTQSGTAAFWRTFHHVEKLAQPGEDGGCTTTPFHYIYHHSQSCSVRSS
jgi:hypothetical protein